MDRRSIARVWLFVLAVTVYDALWARYVLSDIHTWESNPVALWVYTRHGWPGMVGLRAGTLGFAFLVAWFTRSRTLTQVCAVIHLYLLGVHLWGWL